MSTTEDYQHRVTGLLLDAIGGAGFALAGAGAIRAHGLTTRPTEDVDLFTVSTTSVDAFQAAIVTSEAALVEHGYHVTRLRSFPLYARLRVEDSGGAVLDVDLGVNWREHPPVQFGVGPVLSVQDAVAGKMGAAYSRGEVRDFLDVDAIRQSGRFTDAELLRLGHEHDEGFEPGMFASQLSTAARIEPSDAAEYGVDATTLDQVKHRLLAWAKQLEGGPDQPQQ